MSTEDYIRATAEANQVPMPEMTLWGIPTEEEEFRLYQWLETTERAYGRACGEGKVWKKSWRHPRDVWGGKYRLSRWTVIAEWFNPQRKRDRLDLIERAKASMDLAEKNWRAAVQRRRDAGLEL